MNENYPVTSSNNPFISRLPPDNQDYIAVKKDLQNARQRAREPALNGRFPIEVPLDLLETDKVFHPLRQDACGKISSLFTTCYSSILRL